MKKIILIPLFLLLMVQFAFSQSGKITGKVTNSVDGNPIPGVNVVVDGSKKGVSTDFEGSYTINAGSGSTLSFSFLGYETQKIKTDSSVLNVKLKELTSTLDQVVVVGSTVRTSRKELGNAITSVKSEQLLRSQPNSISSALQGKVAGAQISQNSGDPSGGFSIKLRGTSSVLGSSDPLYVVDGVVISNATTNVSSLFVGENSTIKIGQNKSADINPNDIESVEVLNGGSAAAIYGARAANGVILITTKKGKSGEPKFTFSTSTIFNKLRKKIEVNMINKQFKSSALAQFPVATTTTASASTAVVITRSVTDVATLDKEQIDVTRYDYQDNIFTTGYGSDTYFSGQGGDKNTKYSISVGYLENGGIIRNSDFKRLGVKTNLQQLITPKLNLSLGLNYIRSWSNEKPDGNVFYSPINSLNITNNTYDLNSRDINGNLKAIDAGRINPLTVIEDINIKQKTDRVITDATLNYKPFKNFNADLIIGIDTYNQKGTTFIPRYTYAGITAGSFNTGYVSEAINNVLQFNNDLNLNYLWNVTEDLKLTTSAGYNVQMYREQFSATQGVNLKPFVESINAFNDLFNGTVAAGDSQYNIWGYYLQETVGFRNKLFLTGAIRNDASTIFAKEFRSQFFPKISASYVLSNENFIKNSFLSTSRFRGSWGESGNLTAIGPYSRFTNYSTGSLVGNTSFTLEGNRNGNLDLKPERSSTYEFGLDLGLFNDRFTVAATYYNADIKDLLFGVQSAASSGALSTIKNIGKMNNKGFEISANLNVIKTTNFNFSLNATYSENKNEVTELPQERFRFVAGSVAPIFAIVGQPIGVFYGTYFARNPDGTLLLQPNGLPQIERINPSTGLPSRDAITGQPTLSHTEALKVIGDPNPDYILSFGGTLDYKKFGMSFLFDGVQGVDVWDADYRTRQNVGVGNLVAKELTGELPRGYIRSIGLIDEFRIVDGSYIKLREIALNYNFGKLNNVFQNFTVMLSGRNLYSWDNFTSFDPEANSGGQSSVARYNFGAIPIPKTYTLAVKFQF
jgi:TonB-linked SusC/RagA family outer membrane protein